MPAASKSGAGSPWTCRGFPRESKRRPLVEERPEDVRDPVVLFDKADGELVLVGHDPEQVVEVAVLVDEHR